uniref:Uncharacterized protein n=1 Tax=Parascaris univalens TaxID=6257 RepID=A0A914ZUH0_PARUN
MSKIYRPPHSYPYPRTHSLVVVPSKRPAANDEDESSEPANVPKHRPPLNRAIPTIPESKSNESIMTQLSEHRDDSLSGAVPLSSRDLAMRKQQRKISSASDKDEQKLRKASKEDHSIVIENKLAQNLATKTAMSITMKNERSSETPKSPLMSVAHSMRTRLTKLSNRFNKADGRRGIRSSHSLSSMRQRCSDKGSDGRMSGSILDSKLFKKSASMESRPTPSSTSTDSIKSSIPVRTQTTSAASLPALTEKHSGPIVSEEGKQSSNPCRKSSVAEPNKLQSYPVGSSDSTVTDDKSSGPSQPLSGGRNESSGSSTKPSISRLEVMATSAKSSSIITHPSRHPLKPPISPMGVPTRRVTSKMAAAIDSDNRHKVDTKTTQSTNYTAHSTDTKKCKTEDGETLAKKIIRVEPKGANNLMRKVERSFIPLMTSAPKHKIVRSICHPKTSKAPLAECESSRVENSPAVELAPVSFDRVSTSPNQRRRVAARAECPPATLIGEPIILATDNFLNGTQPSDLTTLTREDSNGNIEVTVARTTANEDSLTSCVLNHTEGWPLTSPAASSAETNRGLIDDEIKDQPLLIGSGFIPVDSSTPSRHWCRSLEISEVISTNQAGSQTSPMHMISSLNMASSGYMTSSGLLNSSHNDADSHSELDSIEEQLCNLTICNMANRARSRRSPAADVDADAVVATSRRGSSHPRQEKLDRTAEGPMTFRDVATYESAFQDVDCIKNKLLELQRIINNSVVPDHIAGSDEMHRNGVSVERLLRENDALKKELAEKDRIISALKAQIALN